MALREVLCRSALVASRLPGTDYVVNPYGGCTHRCIYCYARFMKRFTNHTEPWGSYLDVKTNVAELIPERSGRYKGKRVFLSSVTDPYLAAERKYGLTREVLKRLAPLEPVLGVQTKSDLVLRDLDVLAAFREVEVGLTVTSLSDEVRRGIEPGASSPEARLRALRALKDKGFRTYVFVGPVLPGLGDWRAIVEATRDFCDFYYFENLNPAGSAGSDVMAWIASKRPDLKETYRFMLSRPAEFWAPIEDEMRSYCAANKIEGRVVFHHRRGGFDQ